MPSPLDLLTIVDDKLAPPVAIVLGSPGPTAELAVRLGPRPVVCYQMDLYQAERLREELAQAGSNAQVTTAADLWDLRAEFGSVVYAPPKAGERGLKLDMVEQAFHILRPRGVLAVLSAYPADQLFPVALKKVFGKVHAPAFPGGTVLWCRRDGDRPRRRHEVAFQAKVGTGASLRFLSRPGVFSFGRLDDGARALAETMTVEPGDRVLDVGCGCGTNGIFAAQRSGPTGHTVFVDSNVRAVALAEINARAIGLTSFATVASCRLDEWPPGFDLALANPPYYAQLSIAQLFIARARALLRPGGRFYLVTKQADQVGPLVAEAFGVTEVAARRGYSVLCARAACALAADR